ncbi:MAG: hypothetical protein HOV97_40325 [Nonomuraea sp.]|nr:hypothetical protein [Nonomuraea sp.]
MPFAPRPITLVAGGLALSGALLAAPAAYAVVDPAHAVPCAAEAAASLTTLIDPAALQAPGEIPAANCLHHP